MGEVIYNKFPNSDKEKGPAPYKKCAGRALPQPDTTRFCYTGDKTIEYIFDGYDGIEYEYKPVRLILRRTDGRVEQVQAGQCFTIWPGDILELPQEAVDAGLRFF